jgi:hypothetical protein
MLQDSAASVTSAENTVYYSRRFYITKSYLIHRHPGVYISENTPSPSRGGISADVIWRKKYEKVKRERGEKRERKRKKGERK